MYYKGAVCKKSLKKATHCFKLVPDNYINSQLYYYLGRIQHINENYKQALDYYSLAARRNFNKANYRLGMMYEKGQGVDVSLDQATSLYRLAYQANYVKAIYRLMHIRSLSESTLVDMIDKWVDLANVEQNNSDKSLLIEQITSLSLAEQSHLHLWLIRLEKTAEFNVNKLQFIQLTCEIMQGFFIDKKFKALAISIMEINNTNCGDRPAMAYNEINLAYQLMIKCKDVDLDAKLSLLVKAALTSSVIDTISTLVSQQTQSGGGAEVVHIYLNKLKDISFKLPLLLAIRNVTNDHIGRPEWIDDQKVIETALRNWPDFMITFDAFKNILKNNDDFKKEKESITNAMYEKSETLEEESENLDSSTYSTLMQNLKTEFEQQEKELLIRWVFKLVKEHCNDKEIQQIITRCIEKD